MEGGGGRGGARHRICRTQFTRSYCKGKKKYALPSTLLYASGNIFHSKANDIVQDVNFALITLIKKKIKFSSYIRKFRMKQLQSHIWLTASSWGNVCPFSHILGSPSVYDFATAPFWISLYMKKIDFLFYQCTVGASVSMCEQLGTWRWHGNSWPPTSGSSTAAIPSSGRRIEPRSAALRNTGNELCQVGRSPVASSRQYI